MIGENKKCLSFNLPPTTYQKVSDKTPKNTLGEKNVFFQKVIRIWWDYFENLRTFLLTSKEYFIFICDASNSVHGPCMLQKRACGVHGPCTEFYASKLTKDIFWESAKYVGGPTLKKKKTSYVILVPSLNVY